MKAELVAIAGLTVLALAGCGGGRTATANGGVADGGAKVRFIVLGDSGTGYCTEVTDPEICVDGNEVDAAHGQIAVADVVEQVCALRGCDFATLAGDNIYEQGVDSVDSFRFQDSFEIPYQNLDIPFFVSLGNHDNSLADVFADQGGFYGDGRRNVRGDYQVEYSAHSNKWKMPARFYSATWPQNSSSPLLELFVLDSSPLTHYVRDDTGWYSEGYEDYLMDHTAWLQEALADSKAKWKLALGHHPYLSNGDHGNAGSYDLADVPPPPDGPALDGCAAFGAGYAALYPGTSPTPDPSCRGTQYKQMLEETICGQVDVFLQGHDHDLEWLDPVASCGKTQFIVSGAGGKYRAIRNASRNVTRAQEGNTFGFFWIELDESGEMTVAMYTVDHGSDGHGVSRNLDESGQPAPAHEDTVQLVQ